MTAAYASSDAWCFASSACQVIIRFMSEDTRQKPESSDLTNTSSGLAVIDGGRAEDGPDQLRALLGDMLTAEDSASFEQARDRFDNYAEKVAPKGELKRIK